MATSITPESIDLEELTIEIQEQLTSQIPAGYLEGRTLLRDLVADDLGCSEIDAEEIVETLISRGFFRFSGDPRNVTGSQTGSWEFNPSIT